GYSITTQFAVPQAVGQTLTVRVTSVAPWGPNGEYGSAGETRFTTVTVAPPCNDMTTTTTAPTTTAAPTTTLGPHSGPPPTPAPPSGGNNGSTEVEGAVEVRPQVPAPSADAAAQLAFTGSESTTTIMAGLGLLAAGTALVLATRRRTA